MTTDNLNIKLLPPSFSPWHPQKARSKRIAVLMSGGVDSSVAAHLLKQDGWEVLGVTMKIPVSCNASSTSCCGADAALVCNEMGIPHYFVDVTEAFEKLIIERFRKAYETGQTPNPCADCNTFLKFSLVWDFLRRTFEIDSLATGHYARVQRADGKVRLARAADKGKDQSYFLYGLAAERLSKLVLPLGELTKSNVRSIAGRLNLSVAEKPESMELCFAGEADYRIALPQNANQSGTITDMHGNPISTHKGIPNYTLGQRKGIGFAGGKPLYVGRINPRKNTIALGTRQQVSSRIISADQINVLIPEALAAGVPVFGKIRSYGHPKPCRITDLGKTDITVEFDESQFAPCPGQKLVLYNKTESLIAGGTICRCNYTKA